MRGSASLISNVKTPSAVSKVAFRCWSQRAGIFAVIAIGLSACVGGDIQDQLAGSNDKAHINEETKFSQSEYKVESSPRVTKKKRPRKGGGRYQVGKPYKIRGKWYKPTENQPEKQTGMASWYGPNFHGRLTANGEIYDQYSLTAAHPTMPLPSYARVTNLENGRSVMVRVNDRGPFARGRIIDLSARAANLLGYDNAGVTKVKVEYAGKARMDGHDEKILMASYRDPNGGIGSDPFSNGQSTMLALAETSSPALAAVKPAAAIDQNFSVSSMAAFASPPVPMARPTLLEGIPLDNGTAVVYRSAPVPLAFAAHREYRLTDHKVDLRPYVGGHGDAEVSIDAGRFASLSDADYLSSLIGKDGDIRLEQGRAIVVTTEALANRVLDYLLAVGLSDAHIR